MNHQAKRLLAAVLCTCAFLSVPRAAAVEIDPEVQAEFDRLIEIGAGDILDQFLNGLSEEVRTALVEAEEQKWATPTVPTSAEDLPTSGICGISVNWELSGEGKLTITGTGEMFDFREGRPAPWQESRDRILELEIGEGVTSIGSRAFVDCEKLEALSLPQSMELIGDQAFQGCISLEEVRLPGNIQSIGWAAFAGCSVRVSPENSCVSFICALLSCSEPKRLP